MGQRWQSGLRWAVVKAQHFLELRRRWLALAEDQAAAVGRLAQAVLQLETSRRAGPPPPRMLFGSDTMSESARSTM